MRRVPRVLHRDKGADGAATPVRSAAHREPATSGLVAPDSVLRLQQTAGNTAVVGVLAGRPVMVQRAPSTRRTWTKLERGDIGELIVEQILEQRGFEVFRDWDKRVNQGGIDTIAYDPQTDYVYAIDNKAQKKAINNASALSIERLGTENLDDLIKTLDKHTGYSEAARKAFKAGRVRFVLSNAHPGNLNATFSPMVFQRGWYALDIATGGLYSSLREFQAARAAMFPAGGGGGRRGPRGQRGFATVGGMLFSLVSIGGILFALSDVENWSQLKSFVAANVVIGGGSVVAARLAGSAGIGFVVGMLLTMENDHGPGTRRRMAESAMVAEFLHRYFTPEQVAGGGAALEKEARELLFNTPPAMVVDPITERTAAGRLAATAVEQLDGDRSRKVLLSVFLNAAKGGFLKELADILKTRLHAGEANYFNLFLKRLRADWGSKVFTKVVDRFRGAGVAITVTE